MKGPASVSGAAAAQRNTCTLVCMSDPDQTAETGRLGVHLCLLCSSMVSSQ